MFNIPSACAVFLLLLLTIYTVDPESPSPAGHGPERMIVHMFLKVPLSVLILFIFSTTLYPHDVPLNAPATQTDMPILGIAEPTIGMALRPVMLESEYITLSYGLVSLGALDMKAKSIGVAEREQASFRGW